jgi:hypothetical protein
MDEFFCDLGRTRIQRNNYLLSLHVTLNMNSSLLQIGGAWAASKASVSILKAADLPGILRRAFDSTKVFEFPSSCSVKSKQSNLNLLYSSSQRGRRRSFCDASLHIDYHHYKPC